MSLPRCRTSSECAAVLQSEVTRQAIASGGISELAMFSCMPGARCSESLIQYGRMGWHFVPILTSNDEETVVELEANQDEDGSGLQPFNLNPKQQRFRGRQVPSVYLLYKICNSESDSSSLDGSCRAVTRLMVVPTDPLVSQKRYLRLQGRVPGRNMQTMRRSQSVLKLHLQDLGVAQPMITIVDYSRTILVGFADEDALEAFWSAHSEVSYSLPGEQRGSRWVSVLCKPDGKQEGCEKLVKGYEEKSLSQQQLEEKGYEAVRWMDIAHYRRRFEELPESRKPMYPDVANQAGFNMALSAPIAGVPIHSWSGCSLLRC